MSDDLVKRAREVMNGVTPGPWEAALERGCHGIIAQSLPHGGANFVAMVGNDTDTPEKEPSRFANTRLMAASRELVPEMADRIDELEAKLAKAVAALDKLARLGNGEKPGNSDGNMIARAAIAEINGGGDT